jgi:septum formation protein
VTRPFLILGSTSPARREALARLGLPFRVVDPGVDEEVIALEPPRRRALRLARLKARAVRERFPRAIVVASDQTAVSGDRLLHKAQDAAAARSSLRAASGRWVDFYTALAVYSPRAPRPWTACEHTRIRLRRLSEGEIRRYVALDRPVGCAGGFRAEGAGPTLWDAYECTDPTAIVGLPLVSLSRFLRAAGLGVP